VPINSLITAFGSPDATDVIRLFHKGFQLALLFISLCVYATFKIYSTDLITPQGGCE
jgi:hypothetical protein